MLDDNCEDFLTNKSKYLEKSYVYDALDRVSTMETKNQGSTTNLQSDTYTYDKNNQITNRKEERGASSSTNTAYTYNNVGELTKSVQSGAKNQTTTYAYDNVGNRILVATLAMG